MACHVDWYTWDVRCASDADLLWTVAGSIVGTVLVGVLALSLCFSSRQKVGARTKDD
jgi:hypothetical protein